MERTPHKAEKRTVPADALAALHKTNPIEAAVWDLWIERGEARVIEVPHRTDEDLVTLEVAVPRGWRDFLDTIARHRNPDDPGAFLSQELRGMVRAEVGLLLDETWCAGQEKTAEFIETYHLQGAAPLHYSR